MAFEGSRSKSFTFTWKLENVSYCIQKKGEIIRSPSFMVDSVGRTKWYLGLYLRGKKVENFIAFYLYRDTDCKGPAKVEICFQLELVADDFIKQKAFKFEFLKNFAYGTQIFEKREEVFVTKRTAFLPQDTLTARCRIWKKIGEMTEDIQCFARTRVVIQERSFLWNVRNFSRFEPELKCTYYIKSIENDAPLMSIDIYVTDGSWCEQNIRFKLSLQDQTIKFSTLRLSLVDGSGKKVEYDQRQFWFDDALNYKEFIFCVTMNNLIAMKSRYLTDDTLSLHWEWTFSKGIVSEEMEAVLYAPTWSESKSSSNVESKFSNVESELPNAGKVNNETMISLSDILNDLNSLYYENFLCDVKLKTRTCVFNAHKIILSASSSVFKAMFSSDMKEKYNNCVNIDDLSDDTVSRMLVFIYTARLEDLTWDSASNLYVAADKYAILSLKNICSSFLKNNLSSNNACEVLLLSDIHSDEDLKCTAQNYILKYVKDILNTAGWKLLMETNAKLAAETLCLQHK